MGEPPEADPDLVPLTPQEAKQLEKSLAIIESERNKIHAAWVKLGRELTIIRAGKLYKATHKNFGDFCDEVVDLSRGRANQLVSATAVHDLLNTAVSIPPESERQTRELMRLRNAPVDLINAWKAAIAAANGEQPTSEQVTEQVDRIAGPREIAEPKSSDDDRGPEQLGGNGDENGHDLPSDEARDAVQSRFDPSTKAIEYMNHYYAGGRFDETKAAMFAMVDMAKPEGHEVNIDMALTWLTVKIKKDYERQRRRQ